ncbi:MAG: hypothetical protein J7M38_06375 [Armatimonadetes bacterium]|nr:hypothetical protein [Armatimonadota bacterium]
MLTGVSSWAAGPVALVGGGYGRYVRNSTIKKVLLPLEVAYEDFGESMDWSRAGEFSLIIIAHGNDALRAGGDPNGPLEAYVRAGGHVLLIAEAPASLLGARDLSACPWIGARTLVHDRGAPRAAVAAPDHPWLQGVRADRDYYWLHGSQLLSRVTTASVLAGTPDAAYLTVNDYGEGWAAFIARGPFPWKAENVGPDREAQIAVFRRIVLAAGPLTVRGQIAQAMTGSDRDLIVWQRDWQFGSKEGPQFRPPYPRRDEIVESVAMDVARGEREDYQINLLPLEDPGEVTVEVSPLSGEGAGPTPVVEIKVMARAPLIPWNKPGIEPAESPFWLMDPESLPPEGRPAFRPPALANTVIWLQVRSPETCAPGVYRGQLSVTGVAPIPLQITVWPVLMPQDRLFQLKYWGGGTPEARQWDQLQEQGCCNASLSYPDLKRVMVPELGMSLSEALKSQPRIFARDPFPRLDFSYLDDYMGEQAARGLTVVRFQDVKTGTMIANAATGLDIPWQEAGSDRVTDAWRRAWVGYYAELTAWLRSKGFRRVEPIWTDEPSVETIQTRYVPVAEMYLRAGMFPGSHWTTPGFMTSEDVNRFAHAVGDWSMYSIMMPNFFGFLREGEVKLIDGARVGQTRGGAGYLHRSPPDQTRRLCWDAWHNGATYLRTGPLWKSWLYYVNYEKYIRDEGIAGERLIAYSTSDPDDLTAPMLPSPDWIAAREGADDVNLVMVLQWYLERLRGRPGVPEDLLGDIKREIDGFVGDASPWNLHLEAQHYEVKRLGLAYDYTATVDATSSDMRRARRRVLELLERMRPYAQLVPASLEWNEVALTRDGRPVGGVHCPAALRAYAQELSDWLALRTGLRFPPGLGLDADQPGIFIALSGDEGLAELATTYDWDLTRWMPGQGSYSIFANPDAHVVAVVGADEEGLEQGLAAFRAFCSPRGHWLRADDR